MRMVHHVDIEATPNRIWPWLTEADRLKQWMKGLLEVEPLTEGPPGLGARARLTIREGQRTSEYEDEITVWEPPRRLALRMWGGALPEGMEMRMAYHLTDQVRGTRVELTTEAEVKGFFLKLLSPLMRLFAGMQQRSFFRSLKRLVEEEGRTAARPVR